MTVLSVAVDSDGNPQTTSVYLGIDGIIGVRQMCQVLDNIWKSGDFLSMLIDLASIDFAKGQIEVRCLVPKGMETSQVEARLWKIIHSQQLRFNVNEANSRLASFKEGAERFKG